MTESSNTDLRYEIARPSQVQVGAWVWDKDLECLVPKYGRNYHDIDEKRADLPSPAVHSSGSGMNGGFKSMADGKHYETRRNYEKSVARAGATIVGPDKRWQEAIKDPHPFGSDRAHEAAIVADIKQATEIEQSKVPSYGPESRKLMRKQRRRERTTT